MKRIVALLLLIFVNFSSGLNAQTVRDNKLTDSLKNKRIDGDLDKVSQLSAERLSDSLKATGLQRQVDALGTQDDAERSRLMLVLSSLRRKDSLQQERQIKQIDSLRKFIKGAPVIFNRDTIKIR